MASIKHNIIANYIGQGYVLLIGIIITPFYLQYLGAAYGLVGFFALMQAWLNLLDMGLSPTLSRQTAYARGQANGFVSFWSLLKSFEAIFIVIAILIVTVIFTTSTWMATIWVKSQYLETEAIIFCLKAMGVIIGLRWFASLYRSGINGMEDQVWLNIFNIIITSLRFFGILLILEFVSTEITTFFLYQLAVTLIETFVLGYRFYSRLPKIKDVTYFFGFDWQVVKSVAPFALSIAYTSGIWILMTQTDKLILSSTLSLEEFGYFSIIAMIMTGLLTLSSPLMTALLPKMAYLYSQGKLSEVNALYRKATRITTIIIFSFSFALIINADEIIYLWIKNKVASEWISSIIVWFTLGNAILIISGFQYALQQTHGKLRLHVIGSSISAIIQIPIIYFATTQYGALGAGIAWFSIRLTWFLFWPAFIHKYFLPKLHIKWLLYDITPGVLIAMLANYGTSYLLSSINHTETTWLVLPLFIFSITTPIMIYAILFRNTLTSKQTISINP